MSSEVDPNKPQATLSNRPTALDPRRAIERARTELPPTELRPTELPPTERARGESPPLPAADAKTLVRGREPASLAPIDVDPLSEQDRGAPTASARYEAGALLGAGGMGEVRLFRDRVIGREVARKVVHAGFGSRADARERFIREARVQGQLEHPSIVPVYDLALEPELSFTMRRVRGLTLADVIDGLRAGGESAAHFSRRKLLTAFASVCLTIEYAHARGVVHRDLKPANVMLGDFGEVYVLDWGIAKVGASPDPRFEVDAATITPAGAIEGAGPAQTEAGATMGTLGYMPPEQLNGEVVDARADVYALGVMLFEIVALQPLHLGSTAADLVKSTLQGADARAASRAPDAPPELEAIWTRATAQAPADRFPSARALQEAVEAYLDGDRDLALRKAIAQKHADAAAAIASARALDTEDAQRDVMREVGRALTFDPTHEGALQTLMHLRVNRPRELPKEAAADVEAANHAINEGVASVGSLHYFAALLLLPLFWWTGIRDAILLVAMYVPLVSAGLVLGFGRRALGEARFPVTAALSCLAFAIGSRLFGPLVFVPSFVASNATVFALDPSRSRRLGALALSVASIAGPFLLEQLGVLEPSYAVVSGSLAIVPHAISLHGAPAQWLIAIMAVFPIAVSSLFVGTVRGALDAAQREQAINAWQLRQLAPEGAARAGARLTDVELWPLRLPGPKRK